MSLEFNVFFDSSRGEGREESPGAGLCEALMLFSSEGVTATACFWNTFDLSPPLCFPRLQLKF